MEPKISVSNTDEHQRDLCNEVLLGLNHIILTCFGHQVVTADNLPANVLLLMRNHDSEEIAVVSNRYMNIPTVLQLFEQTLT